MDTEKMKKIEFYIDEVDKRGSDMGAVIGLLLQLIVDSHNELKEMIHAKKEKGEE